MIDLVLLFESPLRGRMFPIGIIHGLNVWGIVFRDQVESNPILPCKQIVKESNLPHLVNVAGFRCLHDGSHFTVSETQYLLRVLIL